MQDANFVYINLINQINHFKQENITEIFQDDFKNTFLSHVHVI